MEGRGDTRESTPATPGGEEGGERSRTQAKRGAGNGCREEEEWGRIHGPMGGREEGRAAPIVDRRGGSGGFWTGVGGAASGGRFGWVRDGAVRSRERGALLSGVLPRAGADAVGVIRS